MSAAMRCAGFLESDSNGLFHNHTTRSVGMPAPTSHPEYSGR